jgi:hypothetical protein
VFVDEYDGLVMKLNNVYADALEMTSNLFVALKKYAPVIPYVFITGSSRIAISGLYSGGNNIRDMTYHEDAATVLGYSWDDIEKLFPDHLLLLEVLHGMNRNQLKAEIEKWYNGYVFSPDSMKGVYSIWAINRFMENGEFKPYFTQSGLSRSLVSGAFIPEVVVALGNPNFLFPVIMNRIECWSYDPDTESSEESTIMRLLTGGVVSFRKNSDGELFLKLANEDAGGQRFFPT